MENRREDFFREFLQMRNILLENSLQQCAESKFSSVIWPTLQAITRSARLEVCLVSRASSV